MKRSMNCGEAIREGLIEAALADASVIFFAEGIADPSSVYGTTEGLQKHISKDRIIEMPLSENSLTGVAIGAAMSGKRPVLSFQRVEFALLAMEQIVNNAAKTHYISAGQHRVPIVIRLIVGRGWGQGPEHSQSLESMFALIPGLKVIMPTFPADAKGMIIAAIQDDSPVIVIEHRWCHYVQGDVPAGTYTSSLNGPLRLREGNDLTIVSTSLMTLEAMWAADQLAASGFTVDLFDLRVVRPLNTAPIKESVRKTGRLITIDTGFRMFGIGSEIVSQVAEECFSSLKSPPARIGLPEHPTPSSRGYLPGIYPDSSTILKVSASMLNWDSDQLQRSLQALEAMRPEHPIDVPDPGFKGPF
jgi:pyruvate/2-oxoglutarate/acetoin dehydrogenase E1 component